MNAVTRKTEIAPIDATPEKRMFWSIIADYDLKTGLCELVDNAFDIWLLGNQKKKLEINVVLDSDHQTITVTDNAGGVKQSDLRLLVAPGGSGNDPNAQSIGIFGVGSKRAGVALGRTIQIKTRPKSGSSFQVDIEDDWLETNDWEIAAFEIPNLSAGTTQVHISNLRKTFDESDEPEIIRHLGETYSHFLGSKCSLVVNGTKIKKTKYDNWSYPPSYAPQNCKIKIPLNDSQHITADITAGLIKDREPDADNYGVYFYCNNRMIVKELRTREVGYFVTSEAGVPHPDASLCRVIVRLEGPAILMPWNSSKNGINYDHLAFQKIRPTLIQLVAHFSKLSRRLKHEWDAKVFRHTQGKITKIPKAQITNSQKISLPPLPKVRKQQIEHLREKNKKQLDKMPWTLGLIEAIGAVDVVSR